MSSHFQKKLRVLAVTSELPWPLNSGGHIRSFHLLDALANHFHFRLLCPVQSVHANAITPLESRGWNIDSISVGSRTLLGEGSRLLGATIRGEPYVMYRRHNWPGMVKKWRQLVRAFQPNVIYLDHLDSFLYRHLSPEIPAVIDLHNIYSLLVKRSADELRNPLKKLFLWKQYHKLIRIERRAAQNCEGVLAVSRAEAEHFHALNSQNTVLIPNGVDCASLASLPTGRVGNTPVILFLGTMSWGPNASAARFLTKTVMPKIRQRFSSAQLLIVGRDPPADLVHLHGKNGITVTGSVPDVRPFLEQATVMAVPLDAGGGTRLKILEAFAAGLPVVSTEIGAEGIDATPGLHLILAERTEFTDALIDLHLLVDRTKTMALAARDLARRTYDWSRIGRAAVEIVRDVAIGFAPEPLTQA